MNNGLNKTRTYYRDQCISFRKVDEQYGALYNMAGGYNLKINGVLVPSSEALYQSCRYPYLPDVQKKIISQQSPMTAKMVCKPYRPDSRQDWPHVRVAVMRWILRVKLAMHWSKFGGLLMDTGDMPIVEDSRKDDFWGALRVGEDRLVGQNVLGRLLMELREELRGPGKEALRIVDPPDIPDFLFLGRPIDQVGFGVRRSEFIKPQTQQSLDLGNTTGIPSENHSDKNQKAWQGAKKLADENQMPEIKIVIKAAADELPDSEQGQTGSDRQ
jgi:type I restriction enzyme S subunit